MVKKSFFVQKPNIKDLNVSPIFFKDSILLTHKETANSYPEKDKNFFTFNN